MTTFFDNATEERASEVLRNNGFVQDINSEWILQDHAVWIESESEYIHHDESYYSCEYCGENQLADETIHTDDCSCYCSEDCADSAGYVLSDGEWISAEDGLLCYSTTNHTKENGEYLIGFEVEKECGEWRNGILDYVRRWDWIAVGDGSLDDETGFELVSPAYDMFGERVKRDIEQIGAIDADSSYSCGGHITISRRDKTGMQLEEQMKDITPLIFALFPKRLNNSWAKPKKHGDVSGDKYRAVNVKSNRIEFRVFARVQNRKQLLWRLRLLQLCITCPMSIGYALNVNSSLRAHLREVYSDEEIERKIELYHAFREWYQTESEPRAAIRQYVPICV